MEKKISDYLHLYYGCECIPYKGGFDSVTIHSIINPEIREIALRPLSDMTEEEMLECGNMIYDFSSEPELNKWTPEDFRIGLAPEQLLWLIKKHFDLFGLIDANLAINKTTLTK